MSTTRADVVYRRLRTDILCGRLKPGARLRAEALSQVYEASSSVLREALPRLAGEGLASFIPQQGFRVVSVSREDLLHLTEARVAIEVVVLQQSLVHGTTAWESALVASHHQLSRTPERTDNGDISDEWATAHAQFHTALLAGCPNLRLCSISESLREAAELYRYWSRKAHEAHHRDNAREHKALCDLALARDIGGASAALTSHIETTTQFALESCEEMFT